MASTATLPCSSLHRLPLVREHRRLLPTIERSLRLVDPGLLKVLDDLVGGRAPWPLLLWGSPGRGKTLAALALCDITATAAFWTAEDLATFVVSHEPGEVQGEFEHIGKKALVVLDELATRERSSDLHYSAVKRLVDIREQRAHRVAIYISNVEPAELATVYDDRLASRLTCGTILELGGVDRRRAAR